MPFGVTVDAVLEAAGGNLFTILGLAALGLLVYWYLDERGESASDTVESVGERADSFFGGAIGATGSLITVVASIAVTIGRELLMTGSMLNQVVEAPVVIGHVIVGALAYGGFRGYFPINAAGFGWGFLIITLLALWARYSGGEATS
ncbi:hypothetical protein [Haloplanus natans]|uniref:hypothetical protein n=1 Tax=Haloplanus natans TaxID=376171 RepID=UPI000678014F|nr:hypothetical protein [Haloplanus natans]